jgi:maltooligosyltrehalose trehalohydrolase
VTVFTVWAPAASRMELELEDGRHPMERAAGGWWSLEVAAAGPGSDYRFAVDGGEALPDPRSPWQPGGVHGPSRVVDHGAFAWTDRSFRARPLSSAVIYELHVGTFTPAGTFDGAIERLDHLVDLGVTHVELLPVQEFSGGRGWGYDGVDLFAPHHAYGGPEALKRLVDACHARDLAVLLDVVYNHLGPTGNYLARFGPYFTDRHHTPWGSAVSLDEAGSLEVRRFLCDNALMWLEAYHFDGLRIDAIHAIFDQSAVHVLEQLGTEVRALEARLGRSLWLVAESDLNDPKVVLPREAGGFGMDAQWSDDLHHALHALLTGERTGYYEDFGSLGHLAAALERAFVYDGRYSAFRQRAHGRPVQGLSGHRFLAYLQNHDQVGNRARGERTSHLLSPMRLKAGAALVLTSPFVPMLFQGEEWGASSPFAYFTAHEEPALAAAVREGRRREFAAFGWRPEDIPDPQAEETFESSKLDWSEREREPHAALLTWHRELIALRRRMAELSDGRLEAVRVTFDEEAGWLRLERGAVTLALNLGPAPQAVPLPPGRVRAVLLSSDAALEVGSDSVRLCPDGVALLGPP